MLLPEGAQLPKLPRLRRLPRLSMRRLEAARPLAVGESTVRAVATSPVPVPVPAPATAPVPVPAPPTSLAVASFPAPSSQIPAAPQGRLADLALPEDVVSQSAADAPQHSDTRPFRAVALATSNSSHHSSHHSSHRKKSPGKSWAFEVEAPGVEPGSASHPVGRLRV